MAERSRWNLRCLGANPLIRLSDRIEALAVLTVLVIAVLALPAASQVGQRAYDTRMHTVAEQTTNRHAVQAEVVDGSSGMNADLMGTAYVQVQWPDGPEVRTERVFTQATLRSGDPYTIWLDRSGRVVEAPLTETDAEAGAMAAAVTVWLASVIAGVLLALAVRFGLDRARARAWDRELWLLAHNDDGWANRHS